MKKAKKLKTGSIENITEKSYRIYGGDGLFAYPPGWLAEEERFVQVPYALYQDRRLDNNDRAIFIILLAHRNGKTGKCCPSIESIAHVTDLVPATVKRVRNKLRRLGLIKWTRGSSKFDHCEYTLHPDYVINGRAKKSTRRGNGASDKTTGAAQTGSDKSIEAMLRRVREQRKKEQGAR